MNRDEFDVPPYPLLPLKNVVVFPRNIVTLRLGRPRSIQAVDEALRGDGRLVVVARRDGDPEDLRPEDLHAIGTLAGIVQHERQPDGTLQVVLEGLRRVRLGQVDRTRPVLAVQVEELRDGGFAADEARALIRHVRELTTKYAAARGELSDHVRETVQRTSAPGQLADLLASQLLTDAESVARRQELLELTDPVRRLERVAIHLAGEIANAGLEQTIAARVRAQLDPTRRDAYLRELLLAVHDELGGDEVDALRARIAALRLPPPVRDGLVRLAERLLVALGGAS